MRKAFICLILSIAMLHKGHRESAGEGERKGEGAGEAWEGGRDRKSFDNFRHGEMEHSKTI